MSRLQTFFIFVIVFWISAALCTLNSIWCQNMHCQFMVWYFCSKLTAKKKQVALMCDWTVEWHFIRLLYLKWQGENTASLLRAWISVLFIKHMSSAVSEKQNYFWYCENFVCDKGAFHNLWLPWTQSYHNG